MLVLISFKLTVLFLNRYQYTKVFQCDMSTFIYYTNSLTNTTYKLKKKKKKKILVKLETNQGLTVGLIFNGLCYSHCAFY